MPLTPYVVEGFDGLNLRDDPYAVGATGCTACSDVEMTPMRHVQPRPGFAVRSTISTLSSAATFRFLWALPGNNYVLGVRGSGIIHTYDQTGAQIATSATGTATSSDAYSAVKLGGGTYVANGSGPRFINTAGAVFTVAGWTGFTPVGACLAVTPNSGRLVCEDGNDRVRFSGAGDPTTFDTTDYVDLAPFDGESIRAIVTWRDLTFVFKRTKMFVFTGEGTDAGGGAIFNYRAVTNIPGLDFDGNAVTVARDGVYYVSSTGVYVTTGDQPRKVSTILDPLFAAARGSVTGAHPYKAAFTTSSRPAAHWYADRVYVAYPTGIGVGNDRVLVWDQNLDAWTMWAQAGSSVTGVRAFCSQPIGSTASTDAKLLAATEYYDAAGTNDTRAAIKSLTDTTSYMDQYYADVSGLVASAYTWSWESGLYSLADQAHVAATQESRLDGIGSVALQVATMGGQDSSSGAYDTGSTVTLGTSPTVAAGWQQIDREGIVWQHKLSGTGAAQVDRLVHYIASVKPAGIA